MDLNFNQVNYDGDLEDADEEQLRSLIEQFEAAQESNAAEFEAAKETIEEVEDVDVEDFQDARETLTDEITDYDAFEESPISEDDLEDAAFAKLREYDAYFAELDTDEGDEGDEGEFSDMGTESPEDDNETSDAEFAEEHLGDVPGVNFGGD